MKYYVREQIDILVRPPEEPKKEEPGIGAVLFRGFVIMVLIGSC